jgi:nitrate reductase gamma subunit
VHVWSGFATIAYLFRPYQVVRSRRLNLPAGRNEPSATPRAHEPQPRPAAPAPQPAAQPSAVGAAARVAS